MCGMHTPQTLADQALAHVGCNFSRGATQADMACAVRYVADQYMEELEEYSEYDLRFLLRVVHAIVNAPTRHGEEQTG